MYSIFITVKPDPSVSSGAVEGQTMSHGARVHKRVRCHVLVAAERGRFGARGFGVARGGGAPGYVRDFLVLIGGVTRASRR